MDPQSHYSECPSRPPMARTARPVRMAESARPVRLGRWATLEAPPVAAERVGPARVVSTAEPVETGWRARRRGMTEATDLVRGWRCRRLRRRRRERWSLRWRLDRNPPAGLDGKHGLQIHDHHW